jgi:hypothetical protein
VTDAMEAEGLVENDPKRGREQDSGEQSRHPPKPADACGVSVSGCD